MKKGLEKKNNMKITSREKQVSKKSMAKTDTSSKPKKSTNLNSSKKGTDNLHKKTGTKTTAKSGNSKKSSSSISSSAKTTNTKKRTEPKPELKKFHNSKSSEQKKSKNKHSDKTRTTTNTGKSHQKKNSENTDRNINDYLFDLFFKMESIDSLDLKSNKQHDDKNDFDKQIEEKEKELQKLEKEKTKLENEIEKCSDKLEKIDKETDLENIQNQIRLLRKDIKDLKKTKYRINEKKNWETNELERYCDLEYDSYDDYNSSIDDLSQNANEEKKDARRNEEKEILDEIESILNEESKNLKNRKGIYEELLESLATEKLYGRQRIGLYKVRSLKVYFYTTEAYIAYLELYKQTFECNFESSDDGYLLQQFEYNLPSDFPFKGKVYFLSQSDFYSNAGSTYVDLFTYEAGWNNNSWKISAKLDEKEKNIISDGIKHPFMVTKINLYEKNGKKRLRVDISNAYGEIKASIGNEDGFRATVNGFYFDSETNQKYYNLNYRTSRPLIKLDTKDLLFPNKRIPKGSSLRVFVKDSDFALGGTIKVTQRMEDSLVIDYFNKVSVAIDDNHVRELKNYLDEKCYFKPSDEWYFHPVGNNITSLSEIIFVNNSFGMRVSFEKTDNDIYYLLFKELIKDVSKYGIHADIAVSTKIVFSVVNELEIMRKPEKYATYSRECNRLHSYLISEFLTQKNSTQLDYENGRFINSWKKITDFLKKEKEKNKEYDFIYKKYSRQNIELDRFLTDKSTNELVKDAILNPGSVKNYKTGYEVNFFFNEKIANNQPQQEAVKNALLAAYFYIIQGPPGTGKTTVIRELIQQQLFHNPASRILITSQSDIALDNVLRGLAEFIKINDGITENQIIRCSGGIGKIPEEIKPYSFEEKYKEYKTQYENCVSSNSLVNDIRKEWHEMLTNNSHFEDLIKEHFLKKFKVIGTTCVGLADQYLGLNNIKFDLVIIDEASQILPGDIAIPINRAKKVVLVGDYKQLTSNIDIRLKNGIFNIDDKLHGFDKSEFFDKSLFEQIFEKTPEDAKTELRIQYRMPPVIAGLVNLFYENTLSSGENCYNSEKNPLLLNNNLIFIDMKYDFKYKEEYIDNKFHRKTLVNLYAHVVKSVIEKIRDKKIMDRIVVLVTSKKQVDIVKTELQGNYGQIHVCTVDDFQGNEEEIIIFCMTNTKKNNYFSDERRLNVAFSRSKNTLLIIGSSKTMDEYNDSEKIKQAFDYINKNGLIISYNDFLRSLNYCYVKS